MYITTHEKIINKPDGEKVKITVNVVYVRHNVIEYKHAVEVCPVGKRKYKSIYTDFQHTGIDKSNQALHHSNEELQYVTLDEIRQAKKELWEKIKPQ